jgi:hypothetical protein
METNGKVTYEDRVISPKELYDFVETHRGNEEAVRLEKTDLGNQYGRICDSLTNTVDEAQRFISGANTTKGNTAAAFI